MTYECIIVDTPAPHIRRITLNRPEKRNALNHQLRGDILTALRTHDADNDVHVQIVRGAGTCFSAGYELGDGNEGLEMPFYTPGGDGQWPRHVTEGWMSIWDLAKPVIAQVHGYCLAGGSELATGCDLVYVADDTKMGYPAVRFGTPDMHFHAWFIGMRKAMEMMITGDSLSGAQAVELRQPQLHGVEAEGVGHVLIQALLFPLEEHPARRGLQPMTQLYNRFAGAHNSTDPPRLAPSQHSNAARWLAVSRCRPSRDPRGLQWVRPGRERCLRRCWKSTAF